MLILRYMIDLLFTANLQTILILLADDTPDLYVKIVILPISTLDKPYKQPHNQFP